MLKELFSNRKVYKLSESEINKFSKEILEFSIDEIGKEYQEDIKNLKQIIQNERKKNINIEKAYASLLLDHEVVKAKLNKFTESLLSKNKTKVDKLASEIFGAGENEGA